MPFLFLSEEEFNPLSNDAAAVAERADAFIRDLIQQLDVVRAEADTKAIAEEQNCILLEQKYASLYSEFSRLRYENTQLSASTEKSLSELADAQTEKHQLHIKAIGKDSEIEKLTVEAAELRKSYRQIMELVEQKDAEISERNTTIQSYIEKIVQLSGNNSSTDSKLHEMEAELMHCQANCNRVTQEKELLEKQNIWLDEELTKKSNNIFELRKRQMDVESDMSGKISDLERQAKELHVSLNHSREKVKELELRVKSLEKDLCSSKDIAAANETHFNTELSTVNKLVELYKASSDEWSKKAGELEGVIKALETHLVQVEDDYKETLKNEISLRTDLQKDDFQIELQSVADEAASKVEVIMKRSEEQASMIESLHSSVAMYKRLYEEEHKFRTSIHATPSAVSDDGKKELMLLFDGSQEVSKKAYEQLCGRARILEEDVTRLSTELISARAERDKMFLEANFAKERLDSFMKEFEHQRDENNAVSVRNMELTHLLIDYQKRVRESSASLQASEENSRKLSMEVSILKHEKEILVSSEKRTSDEVQSLMERVHRLQSSLDTNQSAEEVRESARATERRNQDDFIKRLERDWAEAKRDLQKERDLVRVLTLEKERTIETSMSQMEDIRKELSNAWHVVATAESRAAVAEARCSDLDDRIKCIGKQAITEINKHEHFVVSSDEISEDLWKTKEELEKVKDEANAYKEYMLQYKEVAQTNETALKQMELAHDDYKSEAVKMKRVLQDQAQLLQNQISELERKYILKCEEAASFAEAKENALSSAMADISSLRKKVGELEIQISYLNDDLDKEQKRWRTAQDNYERQIILQSETIQELTNTSKELSLKQTEISRLLELFDAKKSENDFLKLSLETEKFEMQQMKAEAERKCNEMDEQNRVLHNRLEALHVRLTEKDQNSVGLLSVSSQEDRDLQKVISYMRRSKEIAETEITLLKQEKLRLQSKVEGALKASESAQALLHSQLENSRELLLKNDEFKSLQLQVREINLLRESNVQLREENKHNIEEWQKFHQEAHNSKVEAEKLENCLKQKQTEVEAFQKEVELLKIEINNLNCKNAEILESYKDININEFERLKDELKQIKGAFVEECLNLLNTASKEELIKLKWIGEIRADNILKLREKDAKPFKNIQDLIKMGLSSKQIKGLMSKMFLDIKWTF